MANSVTFPSSIGGDDNTYTDDNNPDTGLAGGGAAVRLIPMFSNVVNIANYVITVGSNAVNAPATNATSTTSLTIGTGSKSLTLAQTGKLFYIGQTVSISDSTGLNVMSGTITAFDSGTGAMTVSVTNTIGTGTIASWIISVGALSATSTGTSLVKGNGTGGFSAASVRTDYAEPTTALATGILKNTTTTGAHTIAVAGTDYQLPITGGASTITTLDLTPSKALASNASGKVSVATTTLTELNLLSGKTSLATLGANTFAANQTMNGVIIGKGATTNSNALISISPDSSSVANNITTGEAAGVIAIGRGTFRVATSNITGSIAIGDNACYSVSTASNTVAIGANSLDALTTGIDNVAVGNDALTNVVTGNTNVAVGRSALFFATGSQNTGIGYSSMSNVTTEANCSALGHSAQVTGSNQVQAGNSSTAFWCYGAVNNRSDMRDKTDIRDTVLGLDFIQKLRPVDYKWDYREDYRHEMPVAIEIPENATDEEKAVIESQNRKVREEWIESSKLKNLKHDGTHKRKRYHHGLIAQDVQALIKETGVDFGGFKDVSFDGEGDDVLGIGYEELIAPMIKAIQELTARVVELENR